MTKCGVLENLLVKEHTHTFVNKGSRFHKSPFEGICQDRLGETPIGRDSQAKAGVNQGQK